MNKESKCKLWHVLSNQRVGIVGIKRYVEIFWADNFGGNIWYVWQWHHLFLEFWLVDTWFFAD